MRPCPSPGAASAITPPICRAPAADGAWWGPDAEGSAPDSRGHGLAGGATSPRGPQCRWDGRLAATQGELDGLASLAVVNQQQIRRALKREPRTDYTLDLDATQIVAEKQEATWTYKGERGYLPMLGHLAENGLVIGEEFREGHEAPASRNLEFTQPCAAQMPKGKRIAHVRADSAAYQAELFNWCGEHKVTCAIGGVQDTAVQAAIAAIPSDQWQPYRDGQLAETVHCMAKTKQAFRLIVLRRPVQQDLFAPRSPAWATHCFRRTETAPSRRLCGGTTSGVRQAKIASKN